MPRNRARDWLSNALRAHFDTVAVILSPPRCGSTALARSLWQHRAFCGYLHEPYDRAYHDGRMPSAKEVLDSVLERAGAPAGTGRGLVIKEMSFQVADRAAELIEAATLPVILLIRDPMLAVSSRMRCLESGGEAAWFAEREAGWLDLAAIRTDLLRAGRDYVIVDISDVRRDPAAVLAALCGRLGLASDARMLSWQPAGDLKLGQLDGRQDDWYRRVLASTGFEWPGEPLPAAEYFWSRHMQDVVDACMRHYRQAREDPRRVGFTSRGSDGSRRALDTSLRAP